MATYHVSLDLSVPPELDAQVLDRLVRDAISAAACKPLEVMPRSLLIECDPLGTETLEAALREMLETRGGALNSIAFTQR